MNVWGFFAETNSEENLIAYRGTYKEIKDVFNTYKAREQMIYECCSIRAFLWSEYEYRGWHKGWNLDSGL